MVVPIDRCGPNYYSLRRQGQRAEVDQAYGPARLFYLQAEERKPRRAVNLHDLGACSVLLARQRFSEGNEAAAMRELDSAISYYTQAIDAHPGHFPSIEGKSVALKLKGQFDMALKNAEWAAEFTGPSARQYTFLAKELEEQGDVDGAFMRFRQAVGVEPKSFDTHRNFAEFLLRHGNEQAAVFHLQQAYRINSLDPWVTDELASRGALPSLVSQRSNSATPEQTGTTRRP
jgi:tetratricopeptide (TPR) repeat protein